VSPRQLASASFVSGVQRALTLSGLAPERLQLEVTESAVIQNLEQAAGALRRLKQLGVGIALDDFGTGYSSLSHLRELPFDTVKIDRSFVADLPDSQGHAAIARAILGIARAMGFRVVAEGVENERQLRFLEAEGCHEIQGFLLARALPPEALDAFLHTMPLLSDIGDAGASSSGSEHLKVAH
jgi:EAL domain-containing protein (putative c-di-GMP-specific phosphodiesterase class I)